MRSMGVLIFCFSFLIVAYGYVYFIISIVDNILYSHTEYIYQPFRLLSGTLVCYYGAVAKRAERDISKEA